MRSIGNWPARFLGLDGLGEPALSDGALEPRRLLAVDITNPIGDLIVNAGSSPTVISIADRYNSPNLAGSTIARFDTVLGLINVQLEDARTPATVANFLRYVDDDLWDNTIFHRSVSGFVIQGGGFLRPDLDFDPPRDIPTFPPVINEPGISNLRGTIAMAKRADDPDSATSQWFFNLGDNSRNLDNQNGGFTVFGKVILGLDVMDAIAAVPTFVFESPFDELPLRDFANGEGVEVNDYIGINISRGETITYSVISSNPDLVAATLNGTELTLTYTPGREGASNITVRTTAADGTFADDVFTVTVGSRPSVGGIDSSPTGEVRRGTDLVLTASGVSGPINPIVKVQFFRDADGDGQLNEAVDSLIGEDADAGGGYTLSFATSPLATGVQRFFARAVDSIGQIGDAVSTTVTLFVGPKIGEFIAAPESATRNDRIALTARDFDSAPARVRAVEFFHDTNGDNVFDPAVDLRVGRTTSLSNGTASVRVSTKAFRLGTNTLFVRATDSEGFAGEVRSTTIQITNINPTVSGMRASKSTIHGPGAPLELRVTGAKDADGRIARVEYYRDAGDSPDGSLDPETDTLLGAVQGASGSFSLRPDTSVFPVGANRFFARIIDTEGGVGFTVAVSVYINSAPVIASFTASPGSGLRSSDYTLEASGVSDADGVVKRVDFFWDVNGDGVINSGDRSLGIVRNRAGIWTLVIPGKKLGIGENRIIARAWDNIGIAGPFALTTLTLTSA